MAEDVLLIKQEYDRTEETTAVFVKAGDEEETKDADFLAFSGKVETAHPVPVLLSVKCCGWKIESSR
jgi:hypothetical protein